MPVAADLAIFPGFCASAAVLRTADRRASTGGHKPPLAPWRDAKALLQAHQTSIVPVYEWAGSGMAFHSASLLSPAGIRARYRQRHLRLADDEFEQLVLQPGADASPGFTFHECRFSLLLGSDGFDPALLADLKPQRPDAVIWCHAAPYHRHHALKSQAVAVARMFAAVVLLVGRPQTQDDELGLGGSAVFDHKGHDVLALGRDPGLLSLELRRTEGSLCVKV